MVLAEFRQAQMPSCLLPLKTEKKGEKITTMKIHVHFLHPFSVLSLPICVTDLNKKRMGNGKETYTGN